MQACIDSDFHERTEGTCLACRVSHLVRHPVLDRAFRYGHCLDGQSVHTLTNDSRHSRHCHVALFLAACWRMQPASCTLVAPSVLPSGGYGQLGHMEGVKRNVCKRPRMDKRKAYARARHMNQLTFCTLHLEIINVACIQLL